MPKIVINEYDLTKAGTGEYRNFSVVVPGYLGENADKSVFDENGIYECSSQTDFVNNVGKRAAEIVTRSVANNKAPVILKVLRFTPNAEIEAKETTEDGKPCGYYHEITDATITESGYVETWYKDRAEFEAAVKELETTGVYTASINTRGVKGYLADADNIYTKVKAPTDGSAHSTTVSGDALVVSDTGIVVDADIYYIIEADSEGENGDVVEDRITHYGNQIAYELLGMGYTVLYKKMSTIKEDDLSKIVNEYAKEDKVPEKGTGVILVKAEDSAINELSDPNFWECLKDKSTYDFRYLVTGLLKNNDGANQCILEVADHSEEVLLDDASTKDGRGDCIALIDLDCTAYEGTTQTKAIPELAKQAAKWSSAYAAVFAPYVTYIMPDDTVYTNKTFPASFHYLACAANSANNNYNEWYANAGYTRGVSKYTIETTGCKFGEIAIQALEPRFLLKVGTEKVENEIDSSLPSTFVDINTSVAVNLIVKIKSSYYLWGNRTGKKLGTRGASDGDLVAQHFLNIRQLSTTIKKQVYVTCRRLTFDPNSNILWLNFCSLITPMLEQMKADQGIRDYMLVKNSTDRKALLSAKIRIVPIEAVEDFEIGLYLEDSLAEVAVSEA